MMNFVNNVAAALAASSGKSEGGLVKATVVRGPSGDGVFTLRLSGGREMGVQAEDGASGAMLSPGQKVLVNPSDGKIYIPVDDADSAEQPAQPQQWAQSQQPAQMRQAAQMLLRQVQGGGEDRFVSGKQPAEAAADGGGEAGSGGAKGAPMPPGQDGLAKIVGFKVVSEGEAHADGIYRADAAGHILEGPSDGEAPIKDFAAVRLATVNGQQIVTVLAADGLQAAIEELRGGFESPLLRALPLELLKDIFNERGFIDTDTLKALDAALANRNLSIDASSQLQMERIGQWLRIALDNPGMVQELADRIPALGAKEAAGLLELIGRLSSGVAPESFFAAGYTFPKPGADIGGAELLQSLVKAAFSAAPDALLNLVKQIDNSTVALGAQLPPAEAARIAREITKSMPAQTVAKPGSLHDAGQLSPRALETSATPPQKTQTPAAAVPQIRAGYSELTETTVRALLGGDGRANAAAVSEKINALRAAVAQMPVTSSGQEHDTAAAARNGAASGNRTMSNAAEANTQSTVSRLSVPASGNNVNTKANANINANAGAAKTPDAFRDVNAQLAVHRASAQSGNINTLAVSGGNAKAADSFPAVNRGFAPQIPSAQTVGTGGGGVNTNDVTSNNININSVNSNSINTSSANANNVSSISINTNNVNPNRINTNSVNSNSINANRADTNNVNSSSVNTNNVTPNRINTNSVNSNSINANIADTNNVSSSSINTNNVNPNRINTNSVNANSINSNSADTNNVNPSSVNTNNANPNRINTSNPNTNNVNPNRINTNSVNSNSVNTNSADTNNVNSSSVNTNNVNSNRIITNNPHTNSINSTDNQNIRAAGKPIGISGNAIGAPVVDVPAVKEKCLSIADALKSSAAPILREFAQRGEIGAGGAASLLELVREAVSSLDAALRPLVRGERPLPPEFYERVVSGAGHRISAEAKNALFSQIGAAQVLIRGAIEAAAGGNQRVNPNANANVNIGADIRINANADAGGNPNINIKADADPVNAGFRPAVISNAGSGINNVNSGINIGIDTKSNIGINSNAGAAVNADNANANVNPNANADKAATADSRRGDFLQIARRIWANTEKLRAGFREAFSTLDLQNRAAPLDNPAAGTVRRSADTLRTEMLLDVSRALRDVFSSVDELSEIVSQLSSGQKALPDAEAALLRAVRALEHQSRQSGADVMERLKDMLRELNRLQADAARAQEQGGASGAARSSPAEAIRSAALTAARSLENLQLLATQTRSAETEQHLLALPAKIGGEWTEVQIKFVKERKGEKGENKNGHVSIYLNVAPSALGQVTAHLDYRPPNLKLAFQFEKPEVMRWFRQRSAELREALSQAGLPGAALEFHNKRPAGSEPAIPMRQSTDIDSGAVDQAEGFEVKNGRVDFKI